MNRIRKFLRSILWLAVIVAVVIVGLKASHPLMNEYNEMSEKWNVQPFAGQVQAQGPAQGQGPVDMRGLQQRPVKGELERHAAGPVRLHFDQVHKAPHQASFYGRDEHRGWNHGKLIIGLLMLIAGWVLWKRGGRARWVGGVLIVVVLLHLLLMLLTFIVPAVLIYLIWRFFRKPSRSLETEHAAFVSNQHYPTSTVDYLDEWEAKTRRQLKNKEEE